MATQGELRSRAKSGVRAMRAVFRRADTAGEKVERELDRLVKRKTLITPENLTKISSLVVEYIRLANLLSVATSDLAQVLTGIRVV